MINIMIISSLFAPIYLYAECKVSEEAVKLVKDYEQFRSEPYVDSGGGRLAIGYGYQTNVKWGMKWTEKKADKQLRIDLDKIALKLCSVKTLNKNQLGALTSLAYNIGVSGVIKGRLFKTLDSKRFLLYVYANGKKSRGLLKRRIDEMKLFNKH